MEFSQAMEEGKERERKERPPQLLGWRWLLSCLLCLLQRRHWSSSHFGVTKTCNKRFPQRLMHSRYPAHGSNIVFHEVWKFGYTTATWMEAPRFAIFKIKGTNFLFPIYQFAIIACSVWFCKVCFLYVIHLHTLRGKCSLIFQSPLKNWVDITTLCISLALDWSPRLSRPFASPKLTQMTQADRVSRRHHLT